MENLPIPSLRSSWISAIILTTCSFLLYYMVFFPGLLNMYDGGFYRLFYSHKDTVYGSRNSNILNQLDVAVRAPQYIYSAIPVFVFISATNKSDTTMRDVGVYLTSDNPPQYILPSLYNKDVFSSGIVFEEIPAHSTVTGRITLVTQSKTKFDNISIFTKDVEQGRGPSSEPPPLIEWKWKALQHSFIETLLLPPWSNGLIFALVLLSSYLVHKKTCKYDVNPQGCGSSDGDEQATFTAEWLRCVWVNLTWSFVILLATTFLIAIFIIDWLFFVSVPLFLIYMMFLAWRSHDLCVSGLYPTIGILFLLSSLYRIFWDYPNIGFVVDFIPIHLVHGKPIVYDFFLALIAFLSFFLIALSLLLVILNSIKRNSHTSSDFGNNVPDSSGVLVPVSFTKKKSIVSVFLEGHDRSVLKEIRKKIDEFAGKSNELVELYALSEHIDNKTYDEGGFWSVVNQSRDIPLEISDFQKNIIKTRISDLEIKNQEKRLKDMAELGQQKIDELSNNKKDFDIVFPTDLSPVVDSLNTSHGEDIPSPLISDKDTNSNDQTKQEDDVPSDGIK